MTIYGKTQKLDTTGRRSRKYDYKKCLECGKLFNPRNETNVYCSRKCAGPHHGAQITKDLSGKRFGRLLVLNLTDKRQSGSTIWRCRCDCGKEKHVASKHLIPKETLSCGCLQKEIAAEYQKNKFHPCGPKSSGWNPNRTIEERIHEYKSRRDYQYKCFVKKVKKRDKYTCQICNAKNTKLNVHHILLLKKNKNLRIDVSNGITLCVNCHKKQHAKRN